MGSSYRVDLGLGGSVHVGVDVAPLDEIIFLDHRFEFFFRDEEV